MFTEHLHSLLHPTAGTSSGVSPITLASQRAGITISIQQNVARVPWCACGHRKVNAGSLRTVTTYQPANPPTPAPGASLQPFLQPLLQTRYLIPLFKATVSSLRAGRCVNSIRVPSPLHWASITGSPQEWLGHLPGRQALPRKGWGRLTQGQALPRLLPLPVNRRESYVV